MNTLPCELEFGDFLGYHQYPAEAEFDKLIDGAIEVKEGGPLCHCEIYTGLGMSYASRNGIGVNTYDIRMEGLICVLRPKALAQLNPDFIQQQAHEFISKTSGEEYDWKGLMNFYLTSDVTIPKHLFCSAVAIEFYRALTLEIGNKSCPSNKYSPWDIYKLNGFDIIYQGFTL